MSITLDDKKRLLLPRWLPFVTAAKLGEMSSDQKLLVKKGNYLEEKKRDWNAYRELVYAVDLVGTAIIVDEFHDAEVKKAATFILECTDHASQIALGIARTYLGYFPDNGEILIDTNSVNRMALTHKKIAATRLTIKSYPRNPIMWSDLAYYYAVVGNLVKSEKCMDVAISLSPDNRFILRSATRCYLHVKDGDKAHFYLKRSAATSLDPWLLAAEISLAEAIHKKSTFVKQARQVLESQNFSNRTFSELAGSLGTLEFISGSVRASKKLFHRALLDPTENTIAQTESMNLALGITYEFDFANVPGVYEASARILYREKDYKKSLEFTRQWMDFQPFSSSAALFGSYVASVCLMDNPAAIDLIETAKLSAPHDSILENNYAFALASLGKVDKAIDVVRKIKIDNLKNIERYILNATIGMIMYKSGENINGYDLYKKSVKYFESENRNDLASVASLFWGIEELLFNKDVGIKILNDSIKLSKNSNVDEIKNIALRFISSKSVNTANLSSPLELAKVMAHNKQVYDIKNNLSSSLEEAEYKVLLPDKYKYNID